MSFASILSGPTEEERLPPKRPSPPPTQMAPVAPPPSFHIADQTPKEPEPVPIHPMPRFEEKQPIRERRRNVEQEERLVGDLPVAPSANGDVPDIKKTSSAPIRAPAPRKLTERDMEIINKITADIDNGEKSDVETPGFEAEYERYISKGKKRALSSEKAEGMKRKVRFVNDSRRNECVLTSS